MIELAVKSCPVTGGEADESSFEYALALAQGVIYWDVVWDQLSSQLVSHDIEIGEDYVPRPRELPELDQVTNRYQQYLADRKRANEMRQDEALLLPFGTHERESVRLWLEDLGLSELDRCLDAECGYSLVDYYRFIDVLVKRAVTEGYDVLALDRSEFVSECRDAHGIRESAVTALLDDFSLSRRVTGDVPTVEIFSIGRRKRDSRFLRRPIIELVRDGRPDLV